MDTEVLKQLARLLAEQAIDNLLEQLSFGRNTKRKAADLGRGTAAQVMSNKSGGPYESNTKTPTQSSYGY